MRNLFQRRTPTRIAGLVAGWLALAGCGGSRGPERTDRMPNLAPSVPVVTGPSAGITLHPAVFRFSAVDPEADSFTFVVNGVDVAGAELTLTPTTAGAMPLRVAARDSYGHSSAERLHAFDVAPNHPPVFTSAAEVEWLGSGPALDRVAPVQVLETDGDGVELSWSSPPVVRDSQGRAIPTLAVALESVPPGYQVRLSGTLPAGETACTVMIPLRARDLLPGTGILVGTEATQNLFIHYQIVP